MGRHADRVLDELALIAMLAEAPDATRARRIADRLTGALALMPFGSHRSRLVVQVMAELTSAPHLATVRQAFETAVRARDWLVPVIASRTIQR